MSGIAPEALLQGWLEGHHAAVEPVIFGEPFRLPYGRLATVDGWALWLGHPPVPEGVPILPAPEELIWDEPRKAVATALLVAADYAIRRGASDDAGARVVLARESPVAIVVPGPVASTVEPLLEAAVDAGMPVIRNGVDDAAALSALAAPFAHRRAAHAVDLGRPHDPGLSFQERVPEVTIGGNALSSFVVHNEPERDGVTVTGDLNSRVGIEIGVGGPGITLERTAEIEALASSIPSFLDRICCSAVDHSLEIGWRHGDEPTPEHLGGAFQVWLKALTGAEMVDVRLAFAPEKGRSAFLSEMRARASAYREYRDAAIAGVADPLAAVADNVRSRAD